MEEPAARVAKQKLQNVQSNDSKTSDEEINVYFSVHKTIAMKVKRCDTIKDLKKKLREKDGIAENNQDYYFPNGIQLRNSDSTRIMNYGIRNNSTINVYEVMKLYIKMPSNETIFELHVKNEDHIYTIKDKIRDRVGIESNDYSIYYRGKLLEGYCTVGSLKIPSEATLFMIFNGRDIFTVTVKTPTNEVIQLEVRRTHTVSDVKGIVESITGLSKKDWDLSNSREVDLFNGRSIRLPNMMTVADCNIHSGEIVRLLPATYYIGVKNQTDTRRNLDATFLMNVTQMDTIRYVKEQLFTSTGVSVNDQELIYHAQVLEDDNNLEFYCIYDYQNIEFYNKEKRNVTNVSHSDDILYGSDN